MIKLKIIKKKGFTSYLIGLNVKVILIDFVDNS